MIQWNDLTIRQRTSQIQRFNILVDYITQGGGGGSEEIGDILARIEDIDHRIDLLENFIPSTDYYVINVSPTSLEGADVTLKVDNVVYTDETANPGRYVINNITPGEHTIEITCDGYEDYESTFTYTHPASKTIRLEPSEFTVELTIRPADAVATTVTLDGDEMTLSGGKYTLANVSKGTHTIAVEAPGYYDYEQDRSFTYATRKQDIVLTKDRRFDIVITTGLEYPNIVVKVSGNVITPDEDDNYIVENATTGSYTIEATCPGYLDYTTTVNFDESYHTFTITLTPGEETYTVLIIPADESLGEHYDNLVVTFDGDEISAEADGWFRVYNVSAGYYDITAQADGYEDFEYNMYVGGEYNILELWLQKSLQHFDVTLTLDEPYVNPVVRFDGAIIDPTAGGDYIIEEVLEGDHIITCKCDGYLDYQETVTVAEGSTAFLIDLEEPITVVLNVNPAEGSKIVRFDGNTVAASSPGKYVIEDVVAGDYDVSVQQQGYETYTDTLHVSLGHGNFYINLTRNTFTVYVDSNVGVGPSITVKWDGVTIPYDGKLYRLITTTEGYHDLEIHCANYDPYIGRVYVSPQANMLKPTLEESVTYGNIYVHVTPVTSDIYIEWDDISLFSYTPGEYEIPNYNFGTSTVFIDQYGYEDYETTVVTDKNHTEFTFEMTPIPLVDVELYVTPSTGAFSRVYLDGTQVYFYGNDCYGYPDVEQGYHTLTITKDGYRDYSAQIYVSPEDYIFSVNMLPPINNVSVFINAGSSHEADSVKLDGTEMSYDSSTYEYSRQSVSDGEHTIEITKAGYVTYTATETIGPNNKSFIIDLEETPKHTVTIFPTAGEVKTDFTVTLDGVAVPVTRIGDADVYRKQNVPEGDHILSVSKSGYTTYYETVTIDDDHKEFEIELEPVPGYTVTVNATAGGIYQPDSVKLDGINMVIGSGGIYSMTDVPEGTHNLEVVRTGYVTYSENIVVDESHTSFEVTLDPDTLTIQLVFDRRPGVGSIVYLDGTRLYVYDDKTYTVNNVSPGAHSVKWKYSSRETQYTKSINVSATQTTFNFVWYE